MITESQHRQMIRALELAAEQLAAVPLNYYDDIEEAKECVHNDIYEKFLVIDAEE